MELRQYLLIVRRWSWLLALGLLLGAVGGYFFSRMQEPAYQASTRALVMRPPLEQSSDLTYYSDLQLVQTYLQLLTTQPVLDSASERLGYKVSKGQITVKQSPDTQIIAVTVEDGSPRRAAEIANVLLEVLTEYNESMQTGRYASTEQSIRAQIAEVETQLERLQLDVDLINTQSFEKQLSEVEDQIQPLQDEVATLQGEIAALEPAWNQERRTQIAEKQARIEQIQPLLDLYQQIYSNLVVLGQPVEPNGSTSSRLGQLQSTLDLYQNLYLNLLSSLETIRLARLQNTPNIVQIEPATAPEAPVRPRPLMNTTLAGAVGLMLAAGLVFLIEYLDDSLKTPEDVERALGTPALGFVAEMEGRSKKTEQVYVASKPRSPISEAFRTLRTNLEFAAVSSPIRTLLVTSAGPEEGKSTVAANLAAIIALSGKTVALVDADMRRPAVHRLLGLPNRDGLSSLFRSEEGTHTVTRTNVELPRLKVITSGSPPPNPAELLGSEKMTQILAELTSLVDMVIIDSPPALVADAQILAAKVDAVLFVVLPGRTKAQPAAAAMELFRRGGARVIGTVMNRISRRHDRYYGGYKYYSPYASKGYYAQPAVEAEQSRVVDGNTLKPELSPNYSFLQKVARLSSPLDELPPPDPPKT